MPRRETLVPASPKLNLRMLVPQVAVTHQRRRTSLCQAVTTRAFLRDVHSSNCIVRRRESKFMSNSKAEEEDATAWERGEARFTRYASWFLICRSFWIRILINTRRSKRTSEYFDPCQEAADKSLKCLRRNGGDRSMCRDYFEYAMEHDSLLRCLPADASQAFIRSARHHGLTTSSQESTHTH